MSDYELARFAGYCVLFLLLCGASLLLLALASLACIPSYQRRSLRMEKPGAVRDRLHSGCKEPPEPWPTRNSGAK